MATGSRGLSHLQQWMQAVITHPDGVVEGAESPAAQSALGLEHAASVDDLILPSQNLGSRQRIEVYANAYYARLLECLAEEFPALVALLGSETFQAFAFEYLQSYPSQSYTLGELGKDFHRFLSEHQSTPEHDPEQAEQDRVWIDLITDLARVERTYSEVFSGPGIEHSDSLSAAALAAVPPEQLGDLCLVPAPCLRLLALNSRAHTYAIAVRKGDAVEGTLPEYQPTFLTITRLNYVVRTFEADRHEFQILQRLASGESLETAIASVEALDAWDDETLGRKLRSWFQKWATDRLFIDFKIGKR